ncbi:hypothetical protein VTN02DRAFT_3552 [Thermoascus thermophilus]
MDLVPCHQLLPFVRPQPTRSYPAASGQRSALLRLQIGGVQGGARQTADGRRQRNHLDTTEGWTLRGQGRRDEGPRSRHSTGGGAASQAHRGRASGVLVFHEGARWACERESAGLVWSRRPRDSESPQRSGRDPTPRRPSQRSSPGPRHVMPRPRRPRRCSVPVPEEDRRQVPAWLLLAQPVRFSLCSLAPLPFPSLYLIQGPLRPGGEE